MTKELLKVRFAKSLDTYNENAIAQKQMSKKLIEMLVEREYNSVLELGCGTGFVTKELLQKYNIQNYDAVDIVSNCRKYISEISSKVNFICDDIELYTPQKKYDLVISNAALQWLEDFPKFIDKIMTHIVTDGHFAFTVFGKNNYIELNDFLAKNLDYYTKEEISSICSKYKVINIEEDQIKLTFSSPREVLYHIKKTGVNAIYKNVWTKSDLNKFETSYKMNNEGQFELTYNPIYVVIKNI